MTEFKGRNYSIKENEEEIVKFWIQLTSIHCSASILNSWKHFKPPHVSYTRSSYSHRWTILILLHVFSIEYVNQKGFRLPYCFLVPLPRTICDERRTHVHLQSVSFSPTTVSCALAWRTTVITHRIYTFPVSPLLERWVGAVYSYDLRGRSLAYSSVWFPFCWLAPHSPSTDDLLSSYHSCEPCSTIYCLETHESVFHGSLWWVDWKSKSAPTSHCLWWSPFTFARIFSSPVG